jgi:hypothetical protein
LAELGFELAHLVIRANADPQMIWTTENASRPDYDAPSKESLRDRICRTAYVTPDKVRKTFGNFAPFHFDEFRQS